MKITTYDENENVFEKEVTFISIDHNERILISFGFPLEFNINDLLNDYPFNKPLYIDAGGRNHKGSPVYVRAEDINRILGLYVLFEDLF